MKYKYVCAVNFYGNCRVHDGGLYYSLRFYRSLKEFISDVEKSIQQYEFEILYSFRGKAVAEAIEELSSHRVSGIKITIRGITIRTVDDGHGHWKWVRT